MPENKPTISDLMSMPMKDWPEVLKEYTLIVGKFVGHSGDVFADCCQQYIDAGYPDTADTLIADFARSLNR
jgi:hypothetical protein